MMFPLVLDPAVAVLTMQEQDKDHTLLRIERDSLVSHESVTGV